MASNDTSHKQPQPAHTPNVPPRKRKRKQQKETTNNESPTDLSGYQKKQILNHLKKNGCSKEDFAKAVRTYKNTKFINDRLTQYIEDAQAAVHEECDSFCFNNINEWLTLLKEIDMHEHCYYEAAVVVNAIAYNEPQPAPENLGGIDLQEIYKFLGKALLGQPQEQLSTTNAQFLFKEFESLIDEANSTAGDEAAIALKKELKRNADNSQTFNFASQPQHKCNMDPFGLDPQI